MRLEDYTYNLPEELIADKPPKNRGESRLIEINRTTGQIRDNLYKNIAEYFKKGDVLVLNDTKVIKARLFVKKESGADRELVVLERHSFDADWFTHKVMYRGKLKVGDKLKIEGSSADLIVKEILGDGLATIESNQDLRDLCEKFGAVPLPPYMKRDATPLDIERYQTVFADEKGSVAAPTASLNMTEEILQTLKNKGVKICYLTLHVGLGTFMPIRVDDLEKHKMHQEYFQIPPETVEEIQKAKRDGKKVFALGTTVTRTLEYAADSILGGPTEQLTGEADIFIYPGYKFQTIDALITNFHAPKSTVLMLASAFAGWDNLKKAYSHAAIENYHFLSYGDSMIIT
jgi:S-adenosylmethionine:tRNA ribosyltransferase-isomerase